MEFEIIVATANHTVHASAISTMIREASLKRKTGIANRTTAYIKRKMKEDHAILALFKGNVAGFCYIETWSHHKYVANSGLIVAEEFQHQGLAVKIKTKAFELSKKLYPTSKLFGITTSLPVMKINSKLGYKPVTFSELTNDVSFWEGCKGCQNYDVLTRNDFKMCLCTGMLYEKTSKEPTLNKWKKFKIFLKKNKKKLTIKI